MVPSRPTNHQHEYQNGIGNFAIGNHTLGKNNEGTTSFDDRGLTSDILVYPVPCDGSFFIENTDGSVNNTYLYDATGRKIQTISLEPHERKCIENLSSGFYIIKSQGGVVKVIVR